MGPGSPIIFRPNRDPKGRKNFFWRPPVQPPTHLRVWMTWTPSYLKVWIQQCYLPPKLLQYVAYVVTLRSHGRAEAGGHKLEHILFLKEFNSHDSFYWQIFHEPLTLDIFMHIKSTFLRLRPVQKNIS